MLLHHPQELAKSIWQELLPTHGRLAGSLRTSLAVCIAAYILLALRTPAIGPGVFLIFLVSYDTPYLTLSSSIFQLTSQCVGVAIVLILVAATGNDPLVRFLAVPVITFACAYFLRASTRPLAFMIIGIFSINTLGLWESHISAEQLLHLSMWPIATGALSVGCKVAIEYLFTRRDPHHALQREMEARIEAAERVFCLLAQGRSEEELQSALSALTRYAIAGQAKMQLLSEEVQNHPVENYPFRIPPVSIASIARLVDLSASYAQGVNNHPEADDVPQLNRICSALRCLRSGDFDEAQGVLHRGTGGLLDSIESVLSNICTTSNSDLTAPEPVSARPPASWLRKDAWTNPEYAIYATKISLCAAICYFTYNALAWPGIATATLTVLIAGLSSTGASNQKLLFRIVGSVIGGVLFGIGCIVFVYPYADSSLPFFATIAIVSFIAAWVARSGHIGYAGLQIAFSFFLIAFEGFSAPTQMTPARDRVIGVLLALFVMWIIFHRFNSESAIDKMKHTLARLLETEADLFARARTLNAGSIADLRRQAVELIGNIRAFAEVVPYEFDGQREQNLWLRDAIQDAVSTSISVLLVGTTSILHPPHSSDESDVMYSDLEKISAKLRGLSLALHTQSVMAQSITSTILHEGALSTDVWRLCSKLEDQCRAIISGPTLSIATVQSELA